MKSRARAAH